MTELKNVAEKRQKKKKKSRLQRKIGSPIYIYIYIIIFKTPKVGILNFPQLFFLQRQFTIVITNQGFVFTKHFSVIVSRNNLRLETFPSPPPPLPFYTTGRTCIVRFTIK